MKRIMAICSSSTSKKLWTLAGHAGLAAMVIGMWAGRGDAQLGPTPQVIYELQHDVSPPLPDLIRATAARQPSLSGTLVPLLHPKPEEFLAASRVLEEDPGLQTSAPHGERRIRHSKFPGVGANGYAPPDTNGAAGLTQYVQWVNVDYAVYDKKGNLLAGPFPGNALWSGFGGPCQTNNDGDPIVQFDKAANRWVMAQPVYSPPQGSSYMYCVAVSTTPDATGTYNRYAFSIPNNYFPDYPKLGVWPDGYYVSFNAFNSSGSIFFGALACALDRNSMLAGSAATGVCFQNNSSVDSLLPSDLDGSTSPPAGSPNYFVHFISNALDLYQFHVDFNTPSNSTFTGPTTIAVNPFSQACGGGVCIPQAGTSQQLDSLGDRLMYRLAYRNFGDHESLVVNHSVAAGGSVGVRWYELRQVLGSGFGVYQQGTYAPDSNYRWMGSIAMDKAGDLALGYSESSSSMHPAIAYTVHVPGIDPLGIMEAETIIINGSGSQTGGLNRWGDYSSMSIDPVDDCTFWYTNEYLQANGSFNWSTYITSFSLPNCTKTPDFSLSGSPGSQSVLQGSGANYTVNVTALNGYSGTVSLSASGLPSGATASFNPISITGSGSSTITVTVPNNATPGAYTLTIAGTDAANLTHTTTVTLVVTSPLANFSISAAPSNRTVSRGFSTSYTATVTALNGFRGTVGFSVSGLPSRSSASFNPTSVAGSGNSTLTVSTNRRTPTGTYTLTIKGTSGSLIRSTTVTLTVR